MAATASPQYQHFVPRFLLKNFSHPYKPNGEHPKRRRGGAGRKYEKGMFPNDPVVRNVDLLADPPVICEKPVARILGEINMYQDTTKPPDQQHAVEAMLSELESRAGQVFRKIAKAFEQKETGIWLSRDERDLVRKFLFLLKYRSDGMRRRFFHQAPEDYSENDRELMREYMARHGFKRPLDVWFHNIKTIIKLNMDLDNKWILDLTKQMYPDDAMWFVSHVQSYYMAFCTPASDKDEFILTDNSYGVFEGPNHFVKDIGTGKVAGDVHTPLHLFAPVSPKLMIVLRLVVLPEPLENADEEIRNHRALERFLAVDSVYGYEVESLLADLPIAKARNNYTTVVDGRLRLASGEDGKRRKDHKFCFKFFPIGSEHVHMINALLLDNAAPCSSIVFESQDAFARTLEWYLTAPCSIGKLVIGPDSQLRRATLKKLEKISRDLGSDKETVWLEVPELPAIDYEARRAKITAERRKLHRILEQPDAEAVRRVIAEESKPKPGAEQQSRSPYLLLGGSLETFMEDLTQAERMWTLRVKIDSWSAGKVDESIRQRNRELLLEAYLRLPPRRVWLYIKSIREAMLASPEGTDKSGAIVPEDAVARAHPLVAPDRLARLIYIAGMNDVDKRRRPWLNVWDYAANDPVSRSRYASSARLLLFYTPGYIRECGIAEVQRLAKEAQREVLKAARYGSTPTSGMFNEGDIIELLTRAIVRERFTDALRGKLEGSKLGELKEVLFETAYPTPPPELAAVIMVERMEGVHSRSL